MFLYSSDNISPVPSLELEWIDEKKEVLLKGGYILDDDGCNIAAVFDLKDGDKDECHWRPCLFGLVVVDMGARTVVCCLANAAFILTVVIFLFFFDGETIANVDNT